MPMFKEFRDFALKGNVIDMAVGIIIGGAFGTVVKSLVDHVLMPPLGFLMGKSDFSEKALKIPVPGDDPVLIQYGLFINAVIAFLIVAFALFLLIRVMNRVQARFEQEQEAKAAAPKGPTQLELLAEIRDLLKKP